jgi:type VI secretion system protein VasD
MRSRRTIEGARGTALRSSAPGKAAAVLLASLTLAGLTGCGTAPPTRLEASLVAADDVNQDELGRALPVVVRVYELKTAGGFQAADFYGLYDQEGAALGGDLLAREELQLRPGERREIARDVAPGAQHLGVAGAYRQIDKARWRDIHALKQGETNKVEIHLGAKAVSIR